MVKEKNGFEFEEEDWSFKKKKNWEKEVISVFKPRRNVSVKMELMKKRDFSYCFFVIAKKKKKKKRKRYAEKKILSFPGFELARIFQIPASSSLFRRPLSISRYSVEMREYSDISVSVQSM